MSGSGSTQVPPPASDEVAPPLNMMPIVQENRLPTLAFYSWCQQMWASLQGSAGIIPSIKQLLDDVAIIFGMHGDGTLSETGELTVNSSQGRVFVASAFVDTTDADNITSGTLAPARIADGSLNYAKIQNVTDDTLLGRSAGTNGPMMEITIGTNLTLTGGVLNATGGGGGSGTVTNIATGTGLTGGPITTTGTISLATVADQRILANISGGVAAPIPNTLSDIIDDIFGNTRGDLLFRGTSAWSALAPGATANLPLVTGGAGADPAWATNVNVPGWLNVGATGAPTNTTAGDLSSKRLFVGPPAIDTVFGGSLVANPTTFAAGNNFAFEINTVGPLDAGGTSSVGAIVIVAKPTGTVSSSGNTICVNGRTEWNSSGTLTQGFGVSFSARATGSGTITEARGADFFILSSASSVITTGNGAYVRSPSIASGGTVGTANGLNIQPQKVAGVTKGYGVNVVGTTDLNVIAGHTTVGSTADPSTSTALDVNSTDGAFKPPRMTTSQRLALTPSDGMIVFDTNLTAYYGYCLGVWGAFNGGGGAPSGYPAGTPPTVVQVAFNVAGTPSVTFGVAPTNGNLLVAMCFNPTSNAVAGGWSTAANNISGTDFGNILFKVAGAGEPTTQSPLTGTFTTGCMVVWEVHGQAASPIVAAQTQAEQSGTSNLPINFPNCSSMLGLSAVSAVTNNILNAGNIGVQDVLNNTNANRKLAAGHTDLSKSPLVGILANFATTTSTKCGTVLITS